LSRTIWTARSMRVAAAGLKNLFALVSVVSVVMVASDME
jgi:hypothetical protein